MPRIFKPLKKTEGIDCFIENFEDNYKDYHSSGLQNLYKAEGKHFWFKSRRELIIKYFHKYLKLNSSIIEIGAGTAYVAQGLLNSGYDVSVGEIHLSGLKFAQEKGIKNCYQFDLFSPPFEDEFDAIGLFDVIEHLDDDVRAINEVTTMLKPGGKIFITVPAHQWLWSRIDAVANHKRRYSIKSLLNS